ncbi:MAG TPA: bacillithiol biosynthesis deacetylase BshB1 [Cytophagaceae bacterium]
MKLDILVIAAHPDDAELSCAGTILKHIDLGYKVGIVDLTRGELGTRGTPELRDQEAGNASKILGLSVRENLQFADGFFEIDKAHCIELIKVIRKYQPDIVIANAVEDRHPDHGRGGALASRACFLSGLRKIETQFFGAKQSEWRPQAVFHYIQDRYIKPDFVVDISNYWDKKIEAIKAYKSQFYDPQSKEPETYISGADFFDFLVARSQEFGHSIGVKYAEGFTKERHLKINNLFDIV